MKLLYCNILILLFVQYEHIHAQFVLPPTNLNEYDAYGSLLAINEYLAIIAQNDQEQFTIITYPFTNRSEKCTLPYDTIQRNISSLTRFVYNVAIGIKQNASQLLFSYIDENWQRDVFLTTVFLESTHTGCVQAVNRIAINMIDLKMQEHALSGMDPYGKRAYAVGTYYIVCFEIETGITWQLDTALVITEDHFIFAVGHKFINLQFLPYLFVLDVLSRNNVTFSFTIELSKFNFGPSAIDITRDSTMSISLLDEMKWFIIGIPNLDMLLILFWDRSKVDKEPVIVRKHISSQRGAGQLTVKIRGPKGAFRVEMQREHLQDRTIICRYNPTEPGDYLISVKWSDEHVYGSPFHTHIFERQEELDRFLHEQNAYRLAQQQWRDEV
ncbi:unnamed protein product [Adineta steineri]|uniref:Uncharacterized protein n=1 Tax=Adineta steineri TaxID=433720 RepID=A0A814VMT6_9BILA|nr:unnamed protein product [Adineta steineri]